MAIAAPSRSHGQSHPIPAFAWSSTASERRPVRRRSLKRSQDSVDHLRRMMSQHDPPDPASQRTLAGTSMRVGNVSHGRMELRPMPHPSQMSPKSPGAQPFGSRQPPVPFNPDVTWRDSMISESSDMPHQYPSALRQQPVQSQLGRAASPNRPRSRSLDSISDFTSLLAANISGSTAVRTSATPTPAAGPSVTYSPSTGPSGPPQQNGGKHRKDDERAMHTSFNSTSTLDRNMQPAQSVHGRPEDSLAQKPRETGLTKSLDYTKTRISRSVGSTSPKRATINAGSRSRAHSSRVPDITRLVELEAPPSNGKARSLVRVSTLTGQVMAATNTGLVAQITSPSFLDYDLLSDFFLTFRSYMTSAILMDTLVVRLAWAMSRTDDFGRIVRVRVFVALRHWILNYFHDDFVADPNLRNQFCEMVNSLTHHLIMRTSGGDGDLKVMGELKKCWRRTCALYLSIPEHTTDESSADVFPGRVEDLQNAVGRAVAPQTGEGRLDTQSVQPVSGAVTLNDASTAEATRHVDPLDVVVSNPSLPKPSLRDSDQSTPAMSCSLPIMSGLKGRPKTAHATLAATAVGGDGRPALPYNRTPIRRTTKRPKHSRSGSFADATPETGNISADNQAGVPGNRLGHPLWMAGNLVRGETLQPLPPSVPVIAPLSSLTARSSSTGSDPLDSDADTNVEKSLPQSTAHIKRLLGSVRKALAVRHVQGQALDASHQRVRLPNEPTFTSPLFAQEDTMTLKNVRTGVDILADKAANAYLDGLETGEERPERPPQNDRSELVLLDTAGDSPSAPEAARMYSAIARSGRSASFGTTGQPSPLFSGKSRVVPFFPPSRPSVGGRSNLGALSRDGTSGRPFSTSDSINAYTMSNPGDLASATSSDAFEFTQTPLLKRMPGGNLRKADHIHSLVQRSRALSPHTREFEREVAASTPLSTRPEETSPSVAEPTQRKKLSLLSSNSAPIMRPSFEMEVARFRQIPDDKDDGGVESALLKLEGKTSEQGSSHSERAVDGTKTWSIISGQAVPGSGEHDLLTDQDITAIRERVEEINDGDSNAGMQRPIDGKVTRSRPVTFFADQDEDLAVGGYGATATVGREVNEPHQRQLIGVEPPSRPQTFFAEQDDRPVSPVEEYHPGEDHIETHDEGNSSGLESRPRTFFTEQSELDLPRRSARHSVQSYGSTPLLERGVSQSAARRRRSSSDWLKVSLPQPGPAAKDAVASPGGNAPKEANRGLTPRPNPPSTHRSFLLDQGQNLLDAAPQNHAKGKGCPGKQAESFFIDDSTSIMSGNQNLTHPLRLSLTAPPRTLNWLSDQRKEHLSPSVRDHPPAEGFRLRATPTPTGQAEGGPSSVYAAANKSSVINAAAMPIMKHLPFVFGYSSRVLAQQFALIEKDALAEIDWRELIDLSWRQSATPSQTWSECLKWAVDSDKPPTGVDVCIARFNIVVHWAASEIVLCTDLDERVACIVKYLHIASHARAMQNWATMYQLTTALTSADVSRLKHTWERVPQRERDLKAQLEALIVPMRNFHNLRTEMERASLHSDVGCIPFIGIYTHDLIFNTQKPQYSQQVDGLEEGERLINFDKHRTAASIVKNLLRMLDGSFKYDFEPVPEVLSRCLWMACLDKQEIEARSRALEP